MRYRITAEQVMTTWYVTVTMWEPDGLSIVKSTRHFSFAVHERAPDDLFILLQQLSREQLQPAS